MRPARLPLPATILLAAVLGAASPASAACYADYRAKRDGPLRLHYGVIQLSDAECSAEGAAQALASRLGDGWQLLEVGSVFGEEGLEGRRASAGDYFLRY